VEGKTRKEIAESNFFHDLPEEIQYCAATQDALEDIDLTYISNVATHILSDGMAVVTDNLAVEESFHNTTAEAMNGVIMGVALGRVCYELLGLRATVRNVIADLSTGQVGDSVEILESALNSSLHSVGEAVGERLSD
jgi:hypothetical protein